MKTLNEELIEKLEPIIDGMIQREGSNLATVALEVRKYNDTDPASISWTIYHGITGHHEGATVEDAVASFKKFDHIARLRREFEEAKVKCDAAEAKLKEVDLE